MRQVQAHEAPRRDLRQVRRRSHAVARAPRAPGPHRAGQPLLARLVLQGPAEPHRLPARHHAARTGARALLRSLRDRRSGRSRRTCSKGEVITDERKRAARSGIPRQVRRHDGRRGHQGTAEEGRRRSAQPGNPREDEDRDVAAEEAEVRQAPARGRELPQVRQQAGVDDSGRDPGDSAGTAPAGAARWRPLRHLRSERPLPPRHQPQQPAEEADRAARARRHRAQRKAHAAGSRRRAVRQRPPRPRAARRQQPPAQVALRHAQGQAGPLPPEPARQARRLLRPLGHRGRARS